MADDRVIEWARSMAAAEMRAFMRARRRFLKQPAAKRVRELRAAARRLRSLLEDFRDVLPARKCNALARLISLTGEARHASALRKALRGALDARERAAADSLARALRARERQAVRKIRRTLASLRYTA